MVAYGNGRVQWPTMSVEDRIQHLEMFTVRMQETRSDVVRLRVATLASVPKAVLEEMEDFVVDRLRAELPKAFPNRELNVTRDGPIFKIHGDLSLGHA